MKLVRIEWNDAVCESSWLHADYAKQKSVEHCVTVGYLFHETELAYYITSTQGSELGILGYTIIPKGMAVKYEAL